MPYSNLPDDPEVQARMERCVQRVQGQGRSKETAIAICYTAITRRKERRYQPPAGAVGNARQVLAWREQHGDEVKGMTSVGWRRARQLASGKPVSLSVVRRMAAFNRHRQNATVDPKYRDTPWKDAGRVAWLGWGGDTGIDWAIDVSARNKEVTIKEHDGVMIAFFLLEEAAQRLALTPDALPGGATPTPLEELHLTLAFLGKVEGLARRKNALLAALAAFAEQMPVLRGEVSGIGRFAGDEGDGTQALYASFDAPDLALWREQLVGHLRQAGFDPASNHGFTPHITLAYLPKHAPTPEIEVPMLALDFERLTLAWAGEHTAFDLQPAPETSEKAAPEGTRSGYNWGARRGEVIRGRLVRGEGGRFTSSGDASGGTSTADTVRQRREAYRQRRLAKRQARRDRASQAAARRAQVAERKRQREAERAKKRAQAEAEKKRRAAERAARRSAGGDKKKPPSAAARRRERAEELARVRRETLAKQEEGGLNKAAQAALYAFAGGKPVDPDMLASLAGETGLVTRDRQGNYRLSPQGRTFLRAVDRGDVRGALDAISAGQDRVAREDTRARERREREAERERAARQRQLEREAREADRRYRQQQGQKKEAGRAPANANLTVVKQADGRHRWVMFSSNAYRDRDNEIVSTKALEADVTRADADGDYGPLRWWHVPGLDLGDCDYNAMSGRILVESGTFRDERVGACVAAKAAAVQGSIGFIHPPSEPDVEGVFHHIRRFERSLVPAGRAANPFTRLLVQQEGTTVLKEKIDRLVELLGGDRALAEQVVAQAETTQKAADGAGIAFKADETETTSAGGQGVTMTTSVTNVTVKAEDAAPEQVAEDAGDEGEGDGEDLFIGDMTPAEFAALLQDAMAQAMAPMMEMLNVEGKMRGMMDEMKSMIGGYSAQKSDADAARDERVAGLEAALKAANDAHAAKVVELETALKAARGDLDELKGDQPQGTKGYRASQDERTVVAKDHRLSGAGPTPDPNFFGFVTGQQPGQ